MQSLPHLLHPPCQTLPSSTLVFATSCCCCCCSALHLRQRARRSKRCRVGMKRSWHQHRRRAAYSSHKPSLQLLLSSSNICLLPSPVLSSCCLIHLLSGKEQNWSPHCTAPTSSSSLRAMLRVHSKGRYRWLTEAHVDECSPIMNERGCQRAWEKASGDSCHCGFVTVFELSDVAGRLSSACYI